MSDHTSTSQMERFCARALPVPELATIAEHLAFCKSCHQLFQETIERRRDYAPVSFTLAPQKWLRHEHLGYEQLVGYVENSLDNAEREIINIHLQLCGHTNYESFQVYLHADEATLEKARSVIKRRDGNLAGNEVAGVTGVEQSATPGTRRKRRHQTAFAKAVLEKRRG